ncbi:MAG: sulfatase [Melioribacteraceae bacterium]|nr:sulfatase [Melioribacteraceae bacterium]
MKNRTINFIAIIFIIINFSFNETMLAQSENNKQLNFIIIFTDDQGYADVGSFGAEGFETPNLDAMADEGMRFTSFYVAAPSCTPSRASLLTGAYPLRVGLERVLRPASKTGINKIEQTLPELLQDAGYATACIGKWHLGDVEEFLPTQHGFDEFFGLPYSNDMWPLNPKAKLGQFPPIPLIDGSKAIEFNPDQSQLTTRYTERAVDFIEKNKEKPFFLYLAHSMPHVPLFVSDKFKGKSKQGLYGDVIMEIDWSVGEILNKLKELNLDTNTLVLFTSDNGPWLTYGNHGGSAKPLREGKGTTFDGGQRVPSIMKWSGKIPSGKVCDELVTTMDVLPTFVKLANAKMPKLKIDGNDIQPLIFGEANAKTPTDIFYFYNYNELQAVRSGKWKMHLPHQFKEIIEPGKDGNSGKWRRGYINLSLFDIEKDISESTNLADEYPEIVKRLSKAADDFDAELKQNLRPAGHVK